MSIYEKIYIINETAELIGQMLMDVLTVTFAILAAGFLMRDRLNRAMLLMISALGAIWSGMMFVTVNGQFGVVREIAATLTAEQLGELSGLVGYVGTESIMSTPIPYIVLGSHACILLAAVWFLFYCSKQKE